MNVTMSQGVPLDAGMSGSSAWGCYRAHLLRGVGHYLWGECSDRGMCGVSL